MLIHGIVHGLIYGLYGGFLHCIPVNGYGVNQRKKKENKPTQSTHVNQKKNKRITPTNKPINNTRFASCIIAALMHKLILY